MRKGTLFFFICLFLSFNSYAQDQITLQEAIDIALENNSELKQAANNVELAEINITNARADFLPSVNGSFSGSQTVGQQFNQSELAFVTETSNSVSGRLGASLTLFQGFRNILNLRRSRTNEEFQEENRDWTRETLIFNTASNYLQVILNEELLKIARENLESTRKQLEQIKVQVEVGSVPTVDLYNQESIVANDELEVIRRENALSYSKTQLISTLQLNPKKEYEFATPNLKELEPVQENLQLSDLIDKALANRSDLEAQQMLIEANQYDVGLARANYYPSLSLDAGVSTRYSDTYIGPLGEAVGFQDQFFDQFVNRFIGFSVNIPIFNNLDTRTNVQTALINYKNSQLEYESMKYSVYEEIRQAYNDYISFAKELETTEKALQAAERTYETQQERYDVGAGTLIELSEANALYVQAQSDRAQAIFRFIFQKKLLDYYLGQLDENITLP